MTEPSTTNYVPIACDLHSEYELAILHRQPLHLVWSENNVIHDEVVLPLDLATEHHEEFLLCRSKSGATHRIRLDQIRRMKPA